MRTQTEPIYCTLAGKYIDLDAILEIDPVLQSYKDTFFISIQFRLRETVINHIVGRCDYNPDLKYYEDEQKRANKCVEDLIEAWIAWKEFKNKPICHMNH